MASTSLRSAAAAKKAPVAWPGHVGIETWGGTSTGGPDCSSTRCWRSLLAGPVARHDLCRGWDPCSAATATSAGGHAVSAGTRPATRGSARSAPWLAAMAGRGPVHETGGCANLGSRRVAKRLPASPGPGRPPRSPPGGQDARLAYPRHRCNRHKGGVHGIRPAADACPRPASSSAVRHPGAARSRLSRTT